MAAFVLHCGVYWIVWQILECFFFLAVGANYCDQKAILRTVQTDFNVYVCFVVAVIEGAANENGFLLLFVRDADADAGCLLIAMMSGEYSHLPLVSPKIDLIATIYYP